MAKTTVPKTYDPGDMISLNAQFYNKGGDPADPTNVFLKVRSPLGLQATYSPTRTGTGSYYYDYNTDLTDPTGKYSYRFEGTGAVKSAEEKVFFLNPSDFT